MANLLLDPEDLTGTAWGGGNYTITVDTDVAPNGATTADTVSQDGAFGALAQAINGLAAGTTYTFSFYAKRGTATENKLSLYDFSNGAEILPPDSFYAEINGSTWTRVVRTFTTPAGCTHVNFYLWRDAGAAGTFKAWGAYVNVGSSPEAYPGVGGGGLVFNPITGRGGGAAQPLAA